VLPSLRPVVVRSFAAGLPLAALLALPAHTGWAQPSPGSAAPFKAVGHEPAWTLDVGADRLTLFTDYGKTRTVLPLPPATRIDGGRRYEARNDAHTLVVTILDRVCADAMTGMPRPAAVEVSLDGKVFKGCGGDATALLRSGQWMVETVRDRPLALLPTKKNKPEVRSSISLAFDGTGRIAGTTACNTYAATYVLSGDGLIITMPIASARPCQSQALGQQEAAFLETLRAVQRFEIAKDGALVLVAADGGTISARRPQQPVP
jgi:heat shock protein HslJ